VIAIDAVNLGFALAGFACCSLLTIALSLVFLLLRSTVNRVPVYAPDSPIFIATPKYHVEQVEKDHWLDIYRAFEARGWTMIDKADSPSMQGYYDLTFRSKRTI